MSLIRILRGAIPNSLVNLFKHLPMAVAANVFYGFPSKKLTIIGVTGTDGKTTTSTILYHLLHENGYKVALISTVSAKIGDQDIDTGFHVTSPDHFPLQKLLRQIVDKGYTHVVLEVTSHGLDQHRFGGISFEGGIVTNVTEDHLDYHKTWDKYLKAKAKLFDETKFAVLNAEDKSFDYLKNNAKGQVITYGQSIGDWNLENFKFNLKILGQFNYLNSLAASAAANRLGVSKENIKKSLASFEGVNGRMQVMQNDPFTVIVDFAHTPNALKTALLELNKIKKGKLISIFGCAGQRDKNRRKMGFESAKMADITIITAEDPRTEGVEKISQEIAGWSEKGGAKEVIQSNLMTDKNINFPVYVKIADRKKAIDFALGLAKKGDVIGIFGKGHEKSMCYGTEELSWSDQDVVRGLLKVQGKL